MHTSKLFPVPAWVRVTICLVACFTIPLLIIAGYLGLELNHYLIITVGFLASRVIGLAFSTIE